MAKASPNLNTLETLSRGNPLGSYNSRNSDGLVSVLLKQISQRPAMNGHVLLYIRRKVLIPEDKLPGTDHF